MAQNQIFRPKIESVLVHSWMSQIYQKQLAGMDKDRRAYHKREHSIPDSNHLPFEKIRVSFDKICDNF